MVLTEEEKIILENYKTTVCGLASYLGSSYEVTLHSMEDLDHSVIQIMNGFHTGRVVGSPITDLAINMLRELEKSSVRNDFRVYFSRNRSGEPMKSTTIAIRGNGGRIIGLMCINLYLGTPILQYVSDLMPQESSTFAAENFADNVSSAVSQKLEEARNQVMLDPSILPSMRNKEIIRLLYSRHVFELKNAVELVANELGISVNTVYFHLRNFSKKENESK